MSHGSDASTDSSARGSGRGARGVVFDKLLSESHNSLCMSVESQWH
jgi:hypothetical protein